MSLTTTQSTTDDPGEPAVVEAQPALNGRWDTLSDLMPMNPVHAVVLRTGKLLVIAGSGHDHAKHANRIFEAAVWDSEMGRITKRLTLAWDMFCNGMVVLPNGRALVCGGTLEYPTATHPNRFFGEPRTAVFDPINETFADRPNMSGGRWYPTATVLEDGSALVDSGYLENGQPNLTVQRWMDGVWTPAGTAFPGMPLYPRQHLLPTGKVFVSGEKPKSQLYNPATQTFTQVATTNHAQLRTYGTSVLLPLRQPHLKAKVMILGGGYRNAQNQAVTTDTTELIDLSNEGVFNWVLGPKMSKPRKQLNATILPNGQVLISGGENETSPVQQAQIYDPVSNAFRSASTMQFPRGYHSTAVLLPDARVAAFGGEVRMGEYVKQVEVYSPAYLFNPDGSAARRPTITSVAPINIRYGATFEVHHDAPNVSSVVLMRPGAPTHAFDMEQRLVELSFTPASGVLRAQAPPSGKVAPPGYYMLFLLNGQGVPSKAQFVRLVAPGEEGAIALTAVGASSSWPDAPPSAAVDGNPGTSWNSGGFPPASIDLDLGATHAVTRVRLRVNQSPDGNTTHEIYGGPSLSSLALLRTLSGFTTTSTWLETSFSPAAGNVRFLRVRTTVSPSWVGWFEIEVYGTAEG